MRAEAAVHVDAAPVSEPPEYTPPQPGSIRWLGEKGQGWKRLRVPRAAERRRAGLLLGAAVGLLYGVASHAVNAWLLPGIALYLPPLGSVGNTLLLGVAGALIGLVTAWPAASLNGVMLGCVAGVALLEARAWLTGIGTPLLRQMLTAQAFFVPIAAAVVIAVMVPFGLLLRWAVDEVGERFEKPGWQWVRVRPVQWLLALGLALGLWAYYPADVRLALRQMDAMLAHALTAVDESQLPGPLRGAAVPAFINSASRQYRLAWGEDQSAADLRQAGAEAPSLGTSQITLTAHFSTGYKLVCVYASVEYEPRCRAD